MKKVKSLLALPKSNKIFLIVLAIVAIISGSLFYFNVSNNDKTLINTYIENFIINNEYNTLLSVLGTNYFLIFLIWIFGLSIIGIFINLFIYYFKIFVTSLAITSIINIYGFKGLLISLIYVFPHQIISLVFYFVLTIYALNLSLALIDSIIHKKTLNIHEIMKKYNKIFIYSVIVITLTILYEVYLMPYLLKFIY